MLNMMDDKKKRASLILSFNGDEKKEPEKKEMVQEEKSDKAELSKQLIDAVKSENADKVQDILESFFYKCMYDEMESDEY